MTLITERDPTDLFLRIYAEEYLDFYWIAVFWLVVNVTNCSRDMNNYHDYTKMAKHYIADTLCGMCVLIDLVNDSLYSFMCVCNMGSPV